MAEHSRRESVGGMILSQQSWDYFCLKQEQLDAAFMAKAKWNPSSSDRKLAYRVEKAEFVNEFPEQVKWWKHKENDSERILNELGDMIHFIAGYSNARMSKGVFSQFFRGIDKRNEYVHLKNQHDKYRRKWEKYNTRKLLKVLIKTNNLYKSFVLGLYILESLGFTEEQLRQAYDQKNAENFERIASNY